MSEEISEELKVAEKEEVKSEPFSALWLKKLEFPEVDILEQHLIDREFKDY